MPIDDPLGFLALTRELERGVLARATPTPPVPTVPTPGLGSRVLHGVGTVLGAPKAAADYLTRTGARALYRLELPETATTGSVLREAAGLSIDPAVAEPGVAQSYGQRLAGAALEFGTDILTDPTVAVLAAKAPAAVARVAAPVAAAVPALGAAVPAVVPRVAGTAFTGLMTAGAIEAGRQAAQTIQEQGLSPQAAEELFHTGAAGIGAAAGLAHLGSRLRRRAVPEELPIEEPVPDIATEAARRGLAPETWTGDVPPGFEPPRGEVRFPFPETAFAPETEPFALPVDVNAELVPYRAAVARRQPVGLERTPVVVEGELVPERPGLYPVGLEAPAVDAEIIGRAPQLRSGLEIELARRALSQPIPEPVPQPALAGVERRQRALPPAPEAQLGATVPAPEAQLGATVPAPEAQLGATVPAPEAFETAPLPRPETIERQPVVAEAAPGFDAWAREHGITVDPGNRADLVQRWLRENPEVTPEQREAVRIGARRGPAVAYEEPTRTVAPDVDRAALEERARAQARELVPDDEAAASLRAHEDLLRRPGRAAVDAGYDGGIKEALGLEAMPQKPAVLATAIKRDENNPVYLEAVPNEAVQRLDDGPGGVERYEITFGDKQRRVEGLGDDWRIYDERGETGGAGARDSALAEAFADLGGRVSTVHSIDITPRLREVAKTEGFPLFATREQARAARDRLTEDVAAEFRDQELADPKVLRAEVERAMGRPFEPKANMTAPRVNRAFRGASFVQGDDGVFRGRVNGAAVEVHPDATITVDEGQAAAFARSAAARGISAVEAEPVGRTRTLDGRVIVQLAKGVDDAVVDHEALHVAMRLALSKRERAAVLRQYGFDEAKFKGTPEQRFAAQRAAEERGAEAYSAWDTRKPNGAWARIMQFFRNLYRQFFPDAEAVFERLREGKVFSRGATVPDGELGAAFAAARRRGESLTNTLWKKVLGPNRVPSFDIWFREREGRLPSLDEARGDAYARYEREVTSSEGLRERALYEMYRSPELRADKLAKLDKMIESRAGALSQIAASFEAGRGETALDLDAARDVVRELRALTEARDTIRRRVAQEDYLNEIGADPYPDQPEFAVRAKAVKRSTGNVTVKQRFRVAPARAERVADAAEAAGGATTGKPPERPFNLDRMAIPDEDKAAFSRAVESLAPEVEAATARTTLEGIRQAGLEELGVRTDADLKRAVKNGLLGTAAGQHAVRVRLQELRRDSRQAGEALREARRTGVGVDEARAAALGADLKFANWVLVAKGAQAEAARALGAYRILVEPRTEAELLVSRILKRTGGLADTQVAEIIRTAQEAHEKLPDVVTRILKPRFKNKLLELWKAGLLSGPPTHVANISGNLIKQGVTLAETAVSGGIVDPVLAKLQGRARERWTSDAGASWAGVRSAGGRAIAAFLSDARDAFTLAPERIDSGGKGELRVGAIEGAKGRAVRIPFRLLQAADRGFRELAKEQELFKIANRQERAGGQNASDFIAEFRADDGTSARFSGVREALDAAADRETFQGPADPAKFLEGVASGISQLGSKYPGLQLVFPFTKTPAKLATATLERTPYGFKYALDDYRRFKEWERYDAARAKGEDVEQPRGRRVTAGDVSDALTRPLLGTLIGGALAAYAQAGGLTGSGPTDKDDRAALLASGWRPYSFVVDNDDGTKTYVPFNRFEPVSSILGFAADLAETKDAKGAEEAVTKIGGSIVENLTNKTFLAGLEGASNALSDPKRYLGTFVRNLAGSAVPNIVAKTAQLVDPATRETKPEDEGALGFGESVARTLQARIPWLSKRLPERRAGTGVAYRRGGALGGGAERFLSPAVSSREISGADFERLLAQLNIAPAAVRRETRIAGRPYRLDDAEVALFDQADLAVTNLLRAQTARLRAMDPETARKFIRSLYQAGRDQARARVIAGPDFRRRLAR